MKSIFIIFAFFIFSFYGSVSADEISKQVDKDGTILIGIKGTRSSVPASNSQDDMSIQEIDLKKRIDQSCNIASSDLSRYDLPSNETLRRREKYMGVCEFSVSKSVKRQVKVLKDAGLSGCV